MNIENENIEPVTDLGLALGYSNQCRQRSSNNESSACAGAGAGAGANAGSRIDVTFVANDPLSELVWSPHKGLNLKCADSSFVDTKTSLFWDAGPSNVALSPPQSITGRRSTTEKPIYEDNFMTPDTSFHLKNEVSRKDTLSKSPKSDSGVMQPCGLNHEETGAGGGMQEMNTDLGLSVLHNNQKEWLGNSKEDDIPGQVNRKNENILSIRSDQHNPDGAEIDLLSGGSVAGDRDVNSGKQTLQLDISLAIEVNHANESEAFAASLPNGASQDTKHLEKMESTAENDIQYIKSEYACGEASKILQSELAPEVKDNSQQDEEKFPRNKTSLVKCSPTNSKIGMCRRKGKEKASSDGDLNGRMSKDEDDSHESVESCNSAGLFLTGKKRWSFEENLIVGNKRLKKQIEGANGSASIVRQDSSFMNWISNMMKGFSKSMQDEAPPCALTLPQPYHRLENPEKNQGPGPKNIGFQSIFQSLYYPKVGGQETRLTNANYQVGEGSKELEPANNMYNINPTPIACHWNLGRQLLLSNDRFNESTSGNEVDSVTHPKILSEKFAASVEKGTTNSAENKNTSNLARSKEEGTSSNSSLGKRKTNSTAISDSDPPGKTSLKLSHKNDPLASSWITRFVPKIPGRPGPSSNLDHAGGAAECSTKCIKLPHSQNQVDFLNDRKFIGAREQCVEYPLIVSGKNLQNCSPENESYIALNKVKSHNNQKCMYSLNPVLPSPKMKISEAMASLFARRLDAFKHIPPANETGTTAAHANMTCFFCGINGHSLRNCPEISETELGELMRNLNMYSEAEELPSLCIRCFQHSHWAVSCPMASSRARLRLKSNASLDNQFSPCQLQPNAGNEENAIVQIGRENQFQAASAANTSCDGEIQTGFVWKMNEMVVSKEKRSCTSSDKNQIALGSGENKFKENQIMPLSNIVNTQNLDVPRGLFDAVKRLRLSRTDILKWMNSNMSLSHLNGFFLRLRLGKWEEGLGGTGYYVACITGTQRESKPQDGKISVSVNVGGIRCSVESQYVSNHDFVEFGTSNIAGRAHGMVVCNLKDWRQNSF
ncbi:uncharacterized protein LOC107422836 isoform X2 [Ziziphus jujuba]|uniref:Uncharacterized protein LOC107422836 isoform X2 n=1 Tax=Ziziphus jujuba TaxID=326968 RepID=A0ABM3IQ79_ZIZJJ|nr:uncharacterized protein LOC107422836 isoform X2 [Ziziphus jujuba]